MKVLKPLYTETLPLLGGAGTWEEGTGSRKGPRRWGWREEEGAGGGRERERRTLKAYLRWTELTEG